MSQLPQRDETKPAEQQGLFQKFIVARTDGKDAPGQKHCGCEYFVLDVKHDQHAKAALAAYAIACAESHPDLRNDLVRRYALPPPEVAHKPSGYFKADLNGNLLWGQDCVNEEDVFFNGIDEISRPFFMAPQELVSLEVENRKLKLRLNRNVSLLANETLQSEKESLLLQIAELREVLELAKNGLQWYQDQFPEVASETDYETMERINAALEGVEND
ncbi:hypothetical protein [Undibacterium crateris]|uniref:hypothetical protein n=1 Tax=Undibacterium crateris TaxID=2528175 RepID=UPI00192E8C18|nr:hypothetical protein [Undibacterium crateris]NDI85040.1 hypothetical protein [Undibacterium crateris]